MVERTEIFPMSSFLMNDDHFLAHQRGKIMQINQSESNYVTRMLYRTI
jgi:hypothetical protein